MPKVREGGKRLPSYESILWFLHISITALAIIDRFTTNAWPRQMFSIGAGSAGSDRITGFKPGPWSVVAYDVIARISGRFSICAFNFMLISRLQILEQWLASSWIAQNVVDCSNIVEANLRSHKWNGIALSALTVLHVWSILFPLFIDQWKVQVVPGVFEWPLSERTPPGFKDMNPSTEMISMQVDDVFRLVEMTLLLCVLLPLSVKWLSTNWHLGIHLHRFITVLYFVDIVRRHSHPHSWVLNTPIFCIWILDKILSMHWRRRLCADLITREDISPDYIALYWTENSAEMSRGVGVAPKYLMKLKSSNFMESRHPFTSFTAEGYFQEIHNHGANDTTVTKAAVIRVFHNLRKPKLFGDKTSHTQKMARQEHQSDLHIWGPFQSRQSALISKHFVDPQNEGKSLVFIGSGSAVNFMIDALSFAMVNVKYVNGKKIVLLYSTRDRALHTWVKSALYSMVGDFEKRSKGTDLLQGLEIVLSCTAKDNASVPLAVSTFGDTSIVEKVCSPELDATMNSFLSDEDNENSFKISRCHKSSPSPIVKTVYTRINLGDTIPNESIVFCQGSKAFVDNARKLCKPKKNVKFHYD